MKPAERFWIISCQSSVPGTVPYGQEETSKPQLHSRRKRDFFICPARPSQKNDFYLDCQTLMCSAQTSHQGETEMVFWAGQHHRSCPCWTQMSGLKKIFYLRFPLGKESVDPCVQWSNFFGTTQRIIICLANLGAPMSSDIPAAQGRMKVTSWIDRYHRSSSLLSIS